MQTRIEAQNSMAQYLFGTKTSLNRTERSVVEWAMIDDYQAVLDLSCARENILSYYMSHYQLRACGLCFDIGSARELRERLDKAEIMSVIGADIPWQENSFDRILMTNSAPFYISSIELFREVYRVLKPKGIFVAALSTLPVNCGMHSLRRNHARTIDHLRELEELGFSNVAYNRTRFGRRCLIAHKAV